jgi:hypothetical protein
LAVTNTRAAAPMIPTSKYFFFMVDPFCGTGLE